MISGFFRLSGHLVNGGGIAIEDIFCALSAMTDLCIWVNNELSLSPGAILRAGTAMFDPVLFYWVEGLKKVQKSNGL